jgi:hypothetical protein
MAASWGHPTEGELPRPQSLANGTEPHLANPCKRFNGRVSGPRAYPYRMGHGCPLEPPANSSMRNPRPDRWGLWKPHPPSRGGTARARLKQSQRAHLDRLERARARGLDTRLHLLGCTGREWCQSRVRHRSRLKHCRRRLEHVPRPLARFRGETPAEAPTLLQGFGG